MRHKDNKGNSWKHTNGIGLILIPLITFLLIVNACFGQTLTKTVISHIPSEEVVYFEDTPQFRTINAIEPTTVSAGVNEVLTITGENFGERNKVFFANANYGGAGYTAVFDTQILLWTDTEIQVEVPTFAGSGDVRVLKLDNELLAFDGLTVDYAVLNSSHNTANGYVAGRFSHVGQYTFITNLPNEARERFIIDVEDVRCKTKMDWEVGATTSQTVNAQDGINLVKFSEPNELPNNVLGATYNRYAGCIVNGTVEWYLQEIDIVFNSNFSWNYDDIIDGTQHDFSTVMIHELLHASGLGHIIEPSAIMHFSVGRGVIKRDLTISEYDGRENQQNHSTTNEVCGQTLFVDGECQTLGVNEFEQSRIIDTFYYNLLGQKVVPTKGIYIQINTFQNRVERKKVIIK